MTKRILHASAANGEARPENRVRAFLALVIDDMGASAPAALRLLFDHGRGFTEIAPCPAGLRARLPRQCFRNASFAAIEQGSVYTYCEGYALMPDTGAPAEHAWIVGRDGRIIDPSWPDVTDAGRYWGILFATGFLKMQIARKLYSGVLWDAETVAMLIGNDDFRRKATVS